MSEFKVIKSEPRATSKAKGRRRWAIVKGQRQRELDADLRASRETALTRRELKDMLVKELRALPPEQLKRLAKALARDESFFTPGVSPREEAEHRAEREALAKSGDDISHYSSRDVGGGTIGLLIEKADGTVERAGGGELGLNERDEPSKRPRGLFDSVFEQKPTTVHKRR